MSEILNTQRLKRAAENAARALAAGDPKVRAGHFNPPPVSEAEPMVKARSGTYNGRD